MRFNGRNVIKPTKTHLIMVTAPFLNTNLNCPIYPFLIWPNLSLNTKTHLIVVTAPFLDTNLNLPIYPFWVWPNLSFNQEGIYYKWASVKMTLKFHFLWSTLFWLEESVSAVYSDWLRGKSETKSCSWSVADVWRRHLELLHIICTPGFHFAY